MKIIGNVYEETDYDRFVRLEDNRDVLSGRLGKLIASISERYIVNPIIVNEKMEIVDGQGRYEALKHLRMPIHYVISPGARIEDCRRMNKYNTKWSILDFAKSHAKSGKKAYQLILLACKKTGYPISRVLRLSNHGAKGHGREILMSSFEKGTFKFTEDDCQMAIDMKQKIDEIISALQYTGRINDAFIIGIKVAVDTNGYDHGHMLKNCEQCRATYVQMASLSAQLGELERIYNYKTRPYKRLYFTDYMRGRGANIRDYNKTYTPYGDHDVSSLRRK